MAEHLGQVDMSSGGSAEWTSVPSGNSARGRLEHPIDALRCPICRKLVFARDNGILRLRTRILIFEDGYTIAKCRYCRNDVMVPVIMNRESDAELLPIWDEELDGSTG